MKRAVKLSIPATKALRKLGSDINQVRRRRRIPMQFMAERTGLSRATLSKLEKGDATVSMGAYAAVLFVLGLTDRLYALANDTADTIGRRLEARHLPQRIRLARPRPDRGNGKQVAVIKND